MWKYLLCSSIVEMIQWLMWIGYQLNRSNKATIWSWLSLIKEDIVIGSLEQVLIGGHTLLLLNIWNTFIIETINQWMNEYLYIYIYVFGVSWIGAAVLCFGIKDITFTSQNHYYLVLLVDYCFLYFFLLLLFCYFFYSFLSPIVCLFFIVLLILMILFLIHLKIFLILISITILIIILSLFLAM